MGLGLHDGVGARGTNGGKEKGGGYRNHNGRDRINNVEIERMPFYNTGARQ
jgi:hypothetical protein